MGAGSLKDRQADRRLARSPMKSSTKERMTMTYTAVGCGMLAAGVGMALSHIYRRTVVVVEQVLEGLGG